MECRHDCLWRHVGATSRGQILERMVQRSVVLRVLTLRFMERHQNITQKSVERGPASKWSTILKVTNVCKLANAYEMCHLRSKCTGHTSREKMRATPHLWNSKMPRCRWRTSGESASVKRGADAVADNEERARLRLTVDGKRGQKHDIQDVLEPQAKKKARLEPGRGQKRENTHKPLLIWKRRSRRQFLLFVPLLRFQKARARVRMYLSILLSLFRQMLESNLPVLVQLGRRASMKAWPETWRN